MVNVQVRGGIVGGWMDSQIRCSSVRAQVDRKGQLAGGSNMLAKVARGAMNKQRSLLLPSLSSKCRDCERRRLISASARRSAEAAEKDPEEGGEEEETTNTASDTSDVQRSKSPKSEVRSGRFDLQSILSDRGPLFRGSDAADEVVPKTGPYVGRSLPVRNGEIVRTMKRLDYILRVNEVRKKEREQRFHEKASRKRKRLRSERHRKRFQKGIVRLVSLVKQMKHKGL